MIKKYKSLILILLVTFFSSSIAGYVTRINIDPWYQSLNRLPISPPDWVFAPVWTTLYAFMSIAIWIVYEKTKNLQRKLQKTILKLPKN